MFGAVVFSKDRPLQLEGFLRSLFTHCPCLAQEKVTVLVAVSEGFSYASVRRSYPHVQFVVEKAFQDDLTRILQGAPPYVLLGCDDVFFTRPIDPGAIADALATDPALFGISLRLGRNIRPLPAALKDFGPFLRYAWRDCGVPQWNYPFDISATVYHRQDLLGILAAFPGLSSPNYLEGSVAAAIDAGRYSAKPALACYPLSHALTLTVNRVQETHPNPFDASGPSSPLELQHALDAGSVLDTETSALAVNHVIHTDARYFKMRRRDEVRMRSPIPGLVSIICYTYNRIMYLPQMIASVLSQDYQNWELLVYDDCSTDDTASVVAPFLADKRVHFVRGTQNIGGSGAFDILCDLCLSMTKGEFVCFTGDDDMFRPDKTSRQLAMFLEHPELDVVFCDANFIGADGDMLEGDFRAIVSLGFSETSMARLQIHNNYFAHPCVMMRRDVVEVVGGFSCGSAGFCTDYHMWCKIAPFMNVAFQDEKLVDYRIHQKNVSIAWDKLCRQSSLDCKEDIFRRFTIYDFFPELYACNQDVASLASAFLELGSLLLNGRFPHPRLAAHCFEVSLGHASALAARVNLLLALALDNRPQEVTRLASALLTALDTLPQVGTEHVRALIGFALAAARRRKSSLQGVSLLREAPNASPLRRLLR